MRADPRELSRAVSNLLLNAIQHTPAGSPITVSASVVDGRASIAVIDTGGGIDEDDLTRVFDPGWRGESARTPQPAAPSSIHPSPSSGAGLGLAIVRGIAVAHQGEVTVRNVPGGCRFDLILPARARPKRPSRELSRAERQRRIHAIPSLRSICGSQPSSARARADDAVMWRTSPGGTHP